MLMRFILLAFTATSVLGGGGTIKCGSCGDCICSSGGGGGYGNKDCDKIVGVYNWLGSPNSSPPSRQTGQLLFLGEGSFTYSSDRHWKVPFLPFEPAGNFETPSLGRWRRLDDGTYHAYTSRVVLREDALTDNDPLTSNAATWPTVRVLSNFHFACDGYHCNELYSIATETIVYFYKGFPPSMLRFNTSDPSQFDEELGEYQEDLEFNGRHLTFGPNGTLVETHGPSLVFRGGLRNIVGKRVDFPDLPVAPSPPPASSSTGSQSTFSNQDGY